MAKNIKCTEIQLTLHTIIIVIVGILIGASLVGSADELESSLNDKLFRIKGEYDAINQEHEFLVKKFKGNYDKYKELVHNGSEVGCKKIGNYAIDTSRSHKITVDLLETFEEPPKIFVSINGFDFEPKLVKEEKNKESIDFIVTEINEKSFKILIESTDKEFNLEDFDRIDICYLAFTNIDKNYDPLKDSK